MLYKHTILEHPEEENIQFEMEITGLFEDALTRQAYEAVRIKNCKKSDIYNSKSQFSHPPITRIVVDRNKNKANTVEQEFKWASNFILVVKWRHIFWIDGSVQNISTEEEIISQKYYAVKNLSTLCN